MNLQAVEKVARAVLYEGFMLYPYTSSSVKNQQRWNFGVLYPPGYDTSDMQAECLVLGRGEVDVKVRYLYDDEERQIELRVPAPGSSAGAAKPASVSAVAAPVLGHENLYRLTLAIRNIATIRPGSRDEALAHSILSTHAILTVRDGEFLSLLDPPEEYGEAVKSCRNRGLFPVLAGNEGERDTMLASPIILYDYPQVAPESAGDLFDSTEIDEILTLRILTLSDAEKAEIRLGDARAREILERVESLPPEHLQKLHGALRGLRMPTSIDLQVGCKVRLHPRRGADILDIALQGKVGTVEAIEEDFEGRSHIAVVLDDDPGRDLGMTRQPGHRFFFMPEEVERIG